MARHTSINRLLKQAASNLDVGHADRAERLCRKVLAQQPDHIPALGLMGRILQEKEDFVAATKCYQRVLDIVPDDHQTRMHLIHCYREIFDYDTMLALAHEMEADASHPENILTAFRAYLYACDWDNAERLRKRSINLLANNAVPFRYLAGSLLDLNAMPELDVQTIFNIHKLWGQQIMQQTRRRRLRLRPPPPPAGRLRIGYLSADFRRHPVGSLIRPVLDRHHRERFEIFCYAYLHKRDEMTEEIRAVAEHFVDITNMKHDEIATRINNDGIHVLVDLGGHTTNSQLPALAFRPAPVQITWLGYPNTTGLPTVDYRITDRYADLQEGGTRYVEKLLFMPESFLTFAGLPEIPRCKETPAVQNGRVTFGSFNNIRKLNPAVIRTWSRILNAVPGSRLLIKSPGCDLAVVRTHILREFARHSVDESRIEFAAYTHSYAEHATQYNRVDIALDPFPYHGTHTTCEALWMGVPVITLEGKAHVQRVSSSILRNIGYDVTIAASEDEYVEKAVELASIPENLGIVRQCLHTLFRHSSICRPEEFTRRLENLYIEACQHKQIPIPEHLRAPETTRGPAPGTAPKALMICDHLSPLTWHAIRSHCNAVLTGESRAWLTLLVPQVEEMQRILRNLGAFIQLHYGKHEDCRIRLTMAESEDEIVRCIMRHDMLCLPEEPRSPRQKAWMEEARRANVGILTMNDEGVRASQSRVAPLPPLESDAVTIAIPTFNRLEQLKRAVAAALNQRHDNLRVIIADNASTDGTQAWCETLAREDQRVCYVRHPRNLGAAGNFRSLYKMIESDLFVFCSDDDELTPLHLARTLPMFRQHPELGMAYGQSLIVDMDGKALNVLDFTNTVDCIVDPRHELLESFLRNQIIWNSALVRKSAVERLLHGDDPRAAALMKHAFEEAGDYLFGILLLATAPAAYVNTATAKFTINPDSESARLVDGGLELEVGVLEQLPAIYADCFGRDDDMRRAMLAGLELRRRRLQQAQQKTPPTGPQQRRQWNQRIEQIAKRLDRLQATATSAAASSAMDIKEWSRQTSLAVRQFQNADDRTTAITNLRSLRAMFVQAWLEEGQWNESMFRDAESGCRDLMFGGLRHEPLVDDERTLVLALREQLNETDDPANLMPVLLAAMLYSQPHDLPPSRKPDRMPSPFLALYLDFMHTIPEIFVRPGEADRYRAFISEWTGIVHARATSGKHLSGAWRHIVEHFALKTNFIPAYMNDRNLRELFCQRADIMAALLTGQGHRLEHTFPARPASRKRIRLGILANHFLPQTETFASLPFFECLDRQRFEVVLFAFQSEDHPLERYCREHADKFVHLSGSRLDTWVRDIRAHDLDMLLLASNVTAVANPSALAGQHRLARVQMASVASCVTTGMKHVDYYISGEYTEPDNLAQDDYRETVLMLPGPAHCYHFPEEECEGRKIRRADLDAPGDAVLYVSGANYYKITPEVEEAWARIIAETPQAWLLLYPFNPNWSNTYATQPFIRRLKRAFERHDIPSDRLVIVPPKERRADIKAMLALTDVYLDGFPFSGVTSLIDPLEAGVPPVVMQGRRFRSRMAEACLREIRMTELTCKDTEQYIETAVRLGQDHAWRQQVRTRIADAMSATPGFLNPLTYGKSCERLLLKIAAEHGLHADTACETDETPGRKPSKRKAESLS